jgi:teichuronic acid biosynthesis glycosyltransferase TuaH
MGDLVFTFWRETWADSKRRQFMTPDRLVQTLLAHRDVGGLLLADPFRMGPGQIVKRLLGRRPVPAPKRAHATEVVSPMRLSRRDGLGEATLRSTYLEYDRRVSEKSRNMGLKNPAVITTNPFYAAYGSFESAGPVTYYAFDDWAAFDDDREWWPDYIRAYELIRERGHRVCSVSRHLLERLNPIGPGIVVPNGIVPEEWQEPWKVPDWLWALPQPRMLYSGAIHGRLDVGAVREVAERFPGGSVIVIGPVADAEVVRRLTQIPGVHVAPEITERALIAGLTRSVDVCIMPHHRTPLTASMSPLKIYEYCAAGRPVASTDIAPVRGIHKNVVLVSEGASFADGVERALAIGPIPEADRQSFLVQNSWASRHDAILKFAFSD